jgi:hypothetical protein
MSYFSRGNFTASDILTLTGTLTAGALVILGLSVFSGALKPSVNNLYDIGTTTSSWRYVYASSTVFAGGVSSTGNINPTVNNTYSIGSSSLSWKDIYASGTLYIPTASLTGITWTNATGTNTTSTNLAVTNLMQTGAIYPLSHNLYDIGSNALSWKDIYASGTAYIGTKVILPYGTAAAPVLTFKGDTGTGVFGSSNTINLSANGSGVYSANAGNTLITAGGYSYLYGAVVFRPQVNNYSSLGGFGYAWKDVYASGTAYMATSTFFGRTTISPAMGMTTSTLRVGSSSIRGCIVIGDSDGAGVTYLTTLDGVATFSNTNSCE